MKRPIIIELLYAPGCAARDDTRVMVERVIGEHGLQADIREVVITFPEEAVELRFLGSPSLRVNGLDIEPGADKRTDFGMG